MRLRRHRGPHAPGTDPRSRGLDPRVWGHDYRGRGPVQLGS